MEIKYNEGKTTQVPTGRVIGVRKRVRRRIGFDGYSMRFCLIAQEDSIEMALILLFLLIMFAKIFQDKLQ